MAEPGDKESVVMGAWEQESGDLGSHSVSATSEVLALTLMYKTKSMT